MKRYSVVLTVYAEVMAESEEEACELAIDMMDQLSPDSVVESEACEITDEEAEGEELAAEMLRRRESLS